MCHLLPLAANSGGCSTYLLWIGWILDMVWVEFCSAVSLGTFSLHSLSSVILPLGEGGVASLSQLSNYYTFVPWNVFELSTMCQ